MSARNKILIGIGIVIILALLVGGLCWGGCGRTPDPPPAPPPVASAPPIVVTAIIPPPPAPPPPDPDELQPEDVKEFCKAVPNPLRWVFVGPEIGIDGTLVVPVCHNPKWTGRPDRRVTANGLILRTAEGEGSSGTTVGPGATPGGSGWQTMSQTFSKSVLIGKLGDQEFRLGGDSLVVLLPPATQNPVEVFTGECEDIKSRYPEPPQQKDRWLREIWARCKLGDKKNVAVATTMVRTCPVGGCFSRDDAAALDARVRKVEQAVTAAGDKPVPPQTVGYDPSAPSR